MHLLIQVRATNHDYMVQWQFVRLVEARAVEDERDQRKHSDIN